MKTPFSEGPPFEEGPPNLSEELKAKFKKALEGKRDKRSCQGCPHARGFVQVMEFVIEMMMDATGRMDIASQRMEEFIEIFNQLEEREMKARMLGDDGR